MEFHFAKKVAKKNAKKAEVKTIVVLPLGVKFYSKLVSSQFSFGITNSNNNNDKMQAEFTFVVMHMAVVMTLAIFGNLFLGFVIYQGNSLAKQKISPVQLLLLHTCIADLLFALLSLGSEILILNAYPHFYAPEFVCKLVRYLQALPLYASPFLLVAISVDRYQAICRPLVHYRSDRYRRPNCLGFIAWSLAFLCSMPQLFIWHKPRKFQRIFNGNESDIYQIRTPMSDECRTIYGRESSYFKSAYVIWFASVAWLLPSILSAVFYWKVVKTVWKSKYSLNDIGNCKLSSGTYFPTEEYKYMGTPSEHVTRNYIENLRKQSTGLKNQTSEFDRKRIQTIRLTLTIIACNFFLWAPFCIINVVQAFTPNLLSPKIITYIVILGNLNSCVNPWIYIFFNRKMVGQTLTAVIIPPIRDKSITTEIKRPIHNNKCNNYEHNRVRHYTKGSNNKKKSRNRISKKQDI